jgi:hypothetical protein
MRIDPRRVYDRWIVNYEPPWLATVRHRTRDAIAVLRGRPVLTGWEIDMEPHAAAGITVGGDDGVTIGPAILRPLRSRAHVTCNVIDGSRAGSRKE